MKKIGFLGGTFDPPHLGHLFLAKSAIENLGLDRLIFSVANISPSKRKTPPVVDALGRLEMVRIMLEGQEKMSVSDFEVLRGGISYTIDLVHELRYQYPQAILYMIISNDILDVLPSFKEIEKIKSYVKIAVGARSKKSFKASSEHINFENKFLEISSTKLRDFFKSKSDLKKFLDPKVFDFIVQNHLYL